MMILKKYMFIIGSILIFVQSFAQETTLQLNNEQVLLSSNNQNSTNNREQDCQSIQVTIDLGNVIPSSDTSMTHFEICDNQLNFSGFATYPQNGETYVQTDSSSIFHWSVNGENYQTSILNYGLFTPGQYNLSFYLTDVQGCSSDTIDFTVYYSGVAYFDFDYVDYITEPIESSLSAEVLMGLVDLTYRKNQGIVIEDMVCGDSITTSEIVVTNEIGNFASVCVEAEHSYLGDLGFELIGPNGNTVALYDNSNFNGEIYLGEPVDDIINCDVVSYGVAWEYCWAVDANWSTINQELNENDAQSGTSLSPGIYSPDGQFDPFLNANISGLWTLKIIDEMVLDDGYLYNWSLNFTDVFVDSLDIVSQGWVNSSTIQEYSASEIVVFPTGPGLQTYYYTLETTAGCVYTDSVQVEYAADLFGCTHDMAMNFNSDAFIDDGSCEYLSITETEDLQFTIHPNPISNILEIEAREEVQVIKLRDLSGRLMYENSAVSKYYSINTSHWSDGIYILELSFKDSGKWKSKIVKN